jgi:hypothetical protein
MPGLTPWWRETLARWYSHPTATTLVARVGRGGAKSHTATKVAIAEVLFGDWAVPLGELHYFAFVSLNKDEAAQRLTLIKQILSVLAVPFESSGDAVILPELRLGFRVFACQIGAVSGFRCIGYSADEAAKWESADHSANPAREVCTSLDAMCITRPNARRLIISSPWGEQDLHYELFERGEQRDQIVASAPSWVANPGITRQQCEDASRGDDKVFSREYCAVPGGTSSAAFDAADVVAMFEQDDPIVGQRGFVAIDSSSMKNDGFAFVAGKYGRDGLHISIVQEFTKKDFAGNDVGKKFQSVVKRVAAVARSFGVHTIFGDQHEAAGLAALFQAERLQLHTYDWSLPSKEAAFSLLRRLMSEDNISSVEHKKFHDEISGCQAILMPSGRTQYPTNGRDLLSALLTLCHAIVDGQIIVGGHGEMDWSGVDAMKKKYASSPLFARPRGWGR